MLCPSQSKHFISCYLCKCVYFLSSSAIICVQELFLKPADSLIHASEPPKDVFGTAGEDPLSNLSGTNTKSASDSKGAASVEVDLFADPLSESGADKNSAALPKISEAPTKSDGVSKSSAAQPQNEVKKPENIFEEPPKDGTTKLAAGKKAPSTDLFGDDDGDDLFEEPLQAAVKKPQVKETSKGQTDQSKNATTDLFAEEVIRVPAAAAAAKPSMDTSSKTNGLHSDEDDLFSGISFML